VTFFTHDIRIATTVLNKDGTRSIGANAPQAISKTVLAGNVYYGPAVIEGKMALARYMPVTGYDGKPLGMVFTGIYMTEKSETIRNFILIGLFIALFLLVGGSVVSLVMTNKILNPLFMLTSFMDRAASTGQIRLTPGEMRSVEKYSTLKDEIGQTIKSSVSFIKHVSNIADELESVAGGSLTTELDILSPDDVLGTALQHAVDNINDMLVEINASTAQISIGSKQVAEGSQSLAQGSTEQAGSVENLSNSINEIAEKAKSNTEVTAHTTKLMNEMMGAVKEIDEASESISKVIKTIDDIAFQTNILALNAAVEAARAGQYGKGFAVVAEEVRNLASKSAEASKDTDELIANSMQKTKIGVRIAGETAGGLMEIAKSSHEQSTGIERINAEISQITHVVQQNTAIAEQSAATSEEISSRLFKLQEQISQFQLKQTDVLYNEAGLPGRA
jgi:methyl-accepting chemotaxis protein